MCFYQQIGCFMGFSITSCVFSGAMFIYYCITLASYSEMKNLCNRYETYSRGGYNYYSTEYDDCYLRHGFDRDTAEKVAGLGSCLLILSLVELFLALASSIYCCRAVCCNSAAVENTVSNYQLIMFKAILKSFVVNIFFIHILHQIFLHTYRSLHKNWELFNIITHQFFLPARNFSKYIMWSNMPWLKLGNILGYIAQLIFLNLQIPMINTIKAFA